MKRAALLCLLATGCFDSLVSDPCASGFTLHEGECQAKAASGPDGGLPGPDADAGSGSGSDMVCAADTTSDPVNCGACGVVCPSGICIEGACAGAISGHVIAIGHDYQHHDGAMARVIGNAVALGASTDVGIARWHGTAIAASIHGTTLSITEGFAHTGRPAHAVALPEAATPNAFDGVDVLVVDAQTGDGDRAEASATPWASAIASFVTGGGVVIVLEGKLGVSYRFAHGAGLYDVGAPVDATSEVATVVDPTDAVADGVVSPYLAESTSIAYPTAPGATVTTTDGVVVFHLSP